jgi:hypothetical protein
MPGTGINGETPSRKTTGQIVRQGQTQGAFGNDPSFSARGKANQNSDIKPDTGK